jgi:peptidoglycan/LPS O-acetylase OafA/YrhL
MRLAALERRPWLLALVTACGVTLLVPSALALLLPPEILDAAVELGDRRLWIALGALFALTAVLARLSLRGPGRGDEEPATADVEQPRGYLR